MSRENVETMRRSLRAFDRRDRDAWVASRSEDYDVIPIADWPETEVHGRDAAWDFYVEVLGAFQESSVSDDIELWDAGPDKLLLRYRGDLHGRESGADVGFDYWLVSTFRDGKVVRDHWFTNQTEAREAAGLQE